MIITLTHNGINAQIDTLGAQLISLKNKEGQEFIWQRDPSYWKSCSPILFPIVGNCRNNKTNIEGTTYIIQKHGFAREKEYIVEKIGENSASFTITSDTSTLECYPYAFKLTLLYTLNDNGLSFDHIVTNIDTKPITYQIGAHPGFNCPLLTNESFEDYVLEFELEEQVSPISYDVSKLEFNPQSRRTLPWNGKQIPLSYDLFAQDAFFFDNLKSRKVMLKNPKTGNGVQVSYPNFETIAFWTSMPSKGPFLCIEPWNGSAIRSDEDDIFENRHFLQSLEAGETKHYPLEIEIL